MWFVESRNTLEEDLAVSVVDHDITSHKEGGTTHISLPPVCCFLLVLFWDVTSYTEHVHAALPGITSEAYTCTCTIQQ